MDTKTSDALDHVMYNYTASSHRLESENKLLRETVTQLQKELKRLREPALMVCEVCDIIEDKAIIRTPNGNQFLVNIANSCEKIRPGDMVLAEQKNLTIIKKIPITNDYKLEWKEIDKNKILKILVDQHDFSEERVSNTLHKLTEETEKKKQKGLTDFFK